MKAFKRFTIAVAAVLTFLATSSTAVFADEAPKKDGYTYNVTITTGSEDIVFTSAAITGATEADIAKMAGVETKLSADHTVMHIKNVPYGVSLKLTDKAGKLSCIDASKTIYSVKGIRQAGHDETNAGIIAVTGDAEYVVAYGVITNPVNYTVKYVDGSGNELLSPDTFIGNAGEKIQVAFRSVDGYLPDAFRKNMTLSSEPNVENVATFVYHPSKGVNVIYNSITGEATYIYEDGTTTTVVVPAENVTPGAAIAGGAGAGAGAGANAGANADDNADAGNAGADENVIEDEETPLVTQDVVDLDEEDVPLADKAASTLGNAAPIIAGVIVVIAAAGITTIVVMSRKRKLAKVDTKIGKDEK